MCLTCAQTTAASELNIACVGDGQQNQMSVCVLSVPSEAATVEK